MYKYKLTIEYDGSQFFGFQRQNNLITIQEILERAIVKLTNVVDTVVCCAGRTDRGVHATGQVIHFVVPKYFNNIKIKLAINYFLKNYSITVIDAENLGVNSDFHARFSAKERHYQYKILQQDHKPTFGAHLYTWINKPLDYISMHSAAQLLIGKHDFTSFRSKKCSSKSPIKTINEINVTKENNIVIITIKAPSFLYHQVRYIAGALIKIGQNKWDNNKMLEVLLSKDNTKNATLALPNGLYLVKVIY